MVFVQLLEVFIPSLRSPDFSRWEIYETTGTSVTIGPWKKVLSPPRVIANGYLSEAMACNVALAVGILFILIGVVGFRHTTGFPA